MYIDKYGVFWYDEDVKKLPEHKIKDLELHETAFTIEELYD